MSGTYEDGAGYRGAAGLRITRRAFLAQAALAAAVALTGACAKGPAPQPAAGSSPAAAPPSPTSGTSWAVRTADTVLARRRPEDTTWQYEHGLMLLCILQVWRRTGAGRYRRFVEECMNPLIASDGRIRGYSMEEYNLDQLLPGRALLALYREAGEPRYRQALSLLREQLRTQPRTAEGNYWHKRIYPHQVWLDGTYMALPFYAEYAQAFAEPADLDDVASQLIRVEQHLRDPLTGLLYHAWDESRQQRWADPETGCSPCVWGRAVGWYAMALVDVLDLLPAEHPQQAAVVAILQRLAAAIAGVQDAGSGLWYQVLDQAGRAGNYLEASASAMFVYALAKGVRQGHLRADDQEVARRGYQGLLQRLVRVDEEGRVSLEGICAVAGLGGDPYRDGSYDYYMSEPVVANSDKGVAPFILASLELDGV